MNFYIYKITNLINGKFYIGRRQCKCHIAEDTYFGSGKLLKAAIKKHGKDSFRKDILHVCSSIEELVEIEKKIVSEEMVNSQKCYNIAIGGHGGYTFYENRTFKHTEETKRKISAANMGRKRPDLSERNRTCNYWVNKKRTDEDKASKSVAALRRLMECATDFNSTTTCPYCKKSGQLANMKRWHFDNCKSLS